MNGSRPAVPLEAVSPLLVVGNGPAAHQLVDRLRHFGYAEPVTVLGAEDGPAYHRALLTSALDGSLPPEAMELPPPPGDTRVHTGVCAVRIDRARRRVHTADGRVFPYRRLVLATGAAPLVPRLPGLRTPDDVPAPGVAVLRTLADCARLTGPAAGPARTPVTVLGAGSLGVEAAFALALGGRPVTLVHPGPWPMDHLLDQAAGTLVSDRLTAAGVEVVVGQAATAYTPPGPPAAPAALGPPTPLGPAAGTLTLADGRALPTGTLLLCTGVLPETGLARAAGIGVRTGIVVDDGLRTDDPLIHALGDCAEHRGNRGGSLASGWAQAVALARYLTTGARGVAAARRVLRPRIAGPGLVVLGVPGRVPVEETVTLNDPAGARYARLELVGERIVAGVLLGFDRAIATTTELYVHDLPVPRDRLSLLLGRAPRVARAGSAGPRPETVVCLCNNVTHRDLTAAWHTGARDLPALAAATRATTGCGGCTRQVEAACAALASAVAAGADAGTGVAGADAGAPAPALTP
ncbi:FAD-dependent oxidoreductase [Streptomyces sp. NPDC051567]|uniref:FAD-dependent oxidoreductase n=1 Tax=Streptomyces sp. NPDC051567 TaxID=3365660 RepID=UPI0037B0734E